MTQKPIEFEIPEDLPTASIRIGLGGPPSNRLLAVPYICQAARNWCWAACATMLARFMQNNNLKVCEAASNLITGGNCCNGAPVEGDCSHNKYNNAICDRTCTVAEVAQLHEILGMKSAHFNGRMTFDQLHEQIAVHGRPIEVAFSWTDSKDGHVAIVHGVNRADRTLNVNDPWPDTGATVVTYSLLEAAYGRGVWFDTWGDIQNFGS